MRDNCLKNIIVVNGSQADSQLYATCRHLNAAQALPKGGVDNHVVGSPANLENSLLEQISAKQKRIEALEQAARAAQAQHKTDVTEQQQQVWQLQQQLLSQERQSSHAQAGSRTRSCITTPKQGQQKHSATQCSGELSISALQELLFAAQSQVAEQAEQIARLRQEANVADTQLEKLSNLLQAEEAHAQRLELQLDSKTGATKSHFAKVSVQPGDLLSGKCNAACVASLQLNIWRLLQLNR